MRFIALVALTLALSTSALAKPDLNVVLFLIDDLGWRDLGCYGSDYYKTPNIDRLAAEGVRFTDAYAACNVCSPTRASLLTGKYPARLMLTQWLPAGRWDPTKNKMREARFLRSLPLEEFTLSEALRDAGYKTLHVGKWHLGGPPFSLPEHHGFDVNIAGSEHGAPGHYFYPYKGTWTVPTTGKTIVKQTLTDGEEGEYLTDRLTDEAVALIHKNKDRPFFLYFPHYAVHTPLQGKKDKIARYEAVAEDKRQGKPAYAAMVESVDDSVGRVMQTLRELNLDEKTLIIFTSDNGGLWKATSHAPLRANKGSNYEGGLRVPLIVKWPGKAMAGATRDDLAISADFYPTILEAAGLPARPNQHMDGVSLVPTLTGKGDLKREGLYWHYPHYNRHPQSFPAGVVRNGNWKLVEFYESGEHELYDLGADIGESRNVALDNPEVVTRLAADLEAWRTDVGADRMKVNPDYEGGE